VVCSGVTFTFTFFIPTFKNVLIIRFKSKFICKICMTLQRH
jgi:hypothetical protein